MNLSPNIVGVVNQNGCHQHERPARQARPTEAPARKDCSRGFAVVELKNSRRKNPSDTPERQSSHKENICLTFHHDGEDMTKMSRDSSPGLTRKLPPFRTGKYTPKDDVYRDSPPCGRHVLVTPNPKNASCKTSSSPQPFRMGKYVPDDSAIYSLVDGLTSRSPKGSAQSLSPRPRSCSPAQKSPAHEARANSAERLTASVRFTTPHVDHDPVLANGEHHLSCENGERTKVCSSPRNRTRNADSKGSENKARAAHRPTSSVLDNCSDRLKTKGGEGSGSRGCRPKSSAVEHALAHHGPGVLPNPTLNSAPRAGSAKKSCNATSKFESAHSRCGQGNFSGQSKGRTKGGPSEAASRVVKKQLARRTSSNDSDMFIRKGSDSSDRKHSRAKTTTSVCSSVSERIPTAKPRKPRRLPQRNAYVRLKRTPLADKTAKLNSKPAKRDKTIEQAQDIKDGPALKKSPTFPLLQDKYCVKCQTQDGSVRIPPARRCCVMASKLKRINFLPYEKVHLPY